VGRKKRRSAEDMEKTLKQKAAVVGIIALGALGLWAARRDHANANANAGANADDSANANADDHANAYDGNPRNVLGRPWFDKLPQKRSDEADLWIFFAGGIGLEDKGSYFRSTFDLFELERNKDRLDIVFLHDKKKVSTTFTIKTCDEKPPFDLCLVLNTPLKGVTKLYSWGDDEDMDRFVPWARAWKRSADERTKQAVSR
jgi:hypothetical protein